MNVSVGNVNVSASPESVTLRMRHVVAGHPGAVLAFSEAARLVEVLTDLVRRAKVNAPTESDVDAPDTDLRPCRQVATPKPVDMDDLLA